MVTKPTSTIESIADSKKLTSAVLTDLEKFESLCRRLDTFSQESKLDPTAGGSNVVEAADIVMRLRHKLERYVFRVLVVGEFSTGKSTFLNGLLGTRILPTNILPTQATINVLKYGESACVTLHHSQASPQSSESTDIPIEQLPLFTTALTKQANENALGIEYAEIRCPSPYLKDGVELVDTPGLNSTYEFHDVATLRYLPQGNAGIMLINATQFMTDSESNYLSKFRSYMNKMFFVATWVDKMPPDDSFEKNYNFFVERVKNVLDTDRAITIYPVNAKAAERGETTSSGMQAFLRDFESFLVSDEKSREQIASPVRTVLQIASSIDSSLKTQLAAVHFSPEEFDLRIKECLGHVDTLRHMMKDVEYYVSNQGRRIQNNLEIELSRELNASLPQISEFILAWEGDMEEIKEGLQQFVNTTVIEAASRVENALTKQLSILDEELEKKCADFQKSVHATYQALQRPSVTPGDMSLQLDTSISQDRALQWGGSFAIGLAAGVLLAGPLAIIVAFFGGSAFGGWFEKRIRDKQLRHIDLEVRNRLGGQFNECIRQAKALLGDRVAASLKLTSDLMSSQVRGIEGTITEIKRARSAKEQELAQRRQRYSEVIGELAELNKSLCNHLQKGVVSDVR